MMTNQSHLNLSSSLIITIRSYPQMRNGMHSESDTLSPSTYIKRSLQEEMDKLRQMLAAKNINVPSNTNVRSAQPRPRVSQSPPDRYTYVQSGENYYYNMATGHSPSPDSYRPPTKKWRQGGEDHKVYPPVEEVPDTITPYKQETTTTSSPPVQTPEEAYRRFKERMRQREENVLSIEKRCSPSPFTKANTTQFDFNTSPRIFLSRGNRPAHVDGPNRYYNPSPSMKHVDWSAPRQPSVTLSNNSSGSDIIDETSNRQSMQVKGRPLSPTRPTVSFREVAAMAKEDRSSPRTDSSRKKNEKATMRHSGSGHKKIQNEMEKTPDGCPAIEHMLCADSSFMATPPPLRFADPTDEINNTTNNSRLFRTQFSPPPPMATLHRLDVSPISASPYVPSTVKRREEKEGRTPVVSVNQTERKNIYQLPSRTEERASWNSLKSYYHRFLKVQ
ncbi:hypothetical protein AGDE_14885 [Angomonas deanei]|uniref:Uncharacterized protein n=1 Tax=Angomonas deanei TaxID=59799 RepID=A0A7G2CHT5_9TRYP|nr:hypothetical protein AGDE_14885 [Angomonas deanei]CAD2218484.1 hypothetical protein, conserved [Angomonas deanei]|eukprot:EPY20051.1 hypothetical protein AGDE_14885 [Angomonas deanei]